MAADNRLQPTAETSIQESNGHDRIAPAERVFLAEPSEPIPRPPDSFIDDNGQSIEGRTSDGAVEALVTEAQPWQ